MNVAIFPAEATRSFDSPAPLSRAVSIAPPPYVVVVVVQPANQSPSADGPSASGLAIGTEVEPSGIPAAAWPVVRDVCSSLRHRLGDDYRVHVVPLDEAASTVPAPRAFALDYPDLKIDRARYEVRTATRPVELTKGEFELLAYLAENPGLVFTRRQLVDACRGGDRLVDDRSVDVQIFSLRKKLGDAATHIQTIRGVGYRFVPQPAVQPFVPRPR